MAQPFVGEIQLFAGNFAPVGWMFCEGQLLSTTEYQDLFYLIGTTYGGDGVESFALPDLRGRVPIHMGVSPAFGTTYQIGETGGVESVTLTVNQIPSHNHPLRGSIAVPVRGDSPGNTSDPNGNAVAISTGKKFFTKTPSASGLMAPITVTPAGGNPDLIGPAGGSQPHDNMQPYIAVSFIISLFGIFPSQT